MPLIQAGGLRQYYRMEGRDGLPVLILSHSLGCDHTLWDDQAADFESHFRVLRYDARGHGATEAPSGDYSIEMLARDLLALADALDVKQFALCGLSLGGMIGQWISVNAPERLTRMVLANTSARYPDPSIMDTRRKTVLEKGMAAVGEIAMQRFFSAGFLAADSAAAARTRRVLLGLDPAGYAGGCAAIRDMDQISILNSIKTPTMIIVGDLDVSTPWQGHGEVLASEIPHAQIVHLPAGHLSNLERPRSFTAAVQSFLINKPEDTLAAGFARRRAILRNDHVDRAQAVTSDFTRAFQDLITRYAWGTVWQRPGLDDRTRRLLVLAMTAALGRWEEYRIHVRAGLTAGLEPCDVEEALLQTAIYAGVPAANTGFQIASEEMAKP
ncbi:MAG: 3-oxoadipate enol-lactonase [Deltaproteobacteria bacterium]